MPRILVGLIGCGGIQKKHFGVFNRREDTRVAAYADVSTDAIDGFKHRMAEAFRGGDTSGPGFTDLEMMHEELQNQANRARDEQPDDPVHRVVSICTPHTLHHEQTRQALERGVHVLLEKPMVTDAEHAYELEKLARDRGLQLAVGYNTPCHPRFQKLREIIRVGSLGRLRVVVGHLSQNWMQFTTDTWRQKPELSGGGMAYDSGAHLLNSLCWSVESRVARVFAEIDHVGTAVDINSVITIHFENGVMACMGVCGNAGANGAHMAFLFEGGKVEIDPWSASWMSVFEGSEPRGDPSGDAQAFTPADNLIDAVLGRAQVAADARNGIVHSELMDAIYESAQSGQPAHPHHDGV